MADFPTVIDYSNTIISYLSYESTDFGGLGVASTMTSTGAWPAANEAIFVPFRIANAATVVKMFWINGTTVGTNHVDVGIYDSEGNKLVSSGSTLTVGASSIQSVDITDTTLQRGLYYMAMVLDGTTDTTSRSIPPIQLVRAIGVYGMAAAFVLPATATYAASVRAWIPSLFLTLQTII